MSQVARGEQPNPNLESLLGGGRKVLPGPEKQAPQGTLAEAELPTDLQIAHRGARDYSDLLRVLPEELRTLLSAPDVRAAFLGLQPVTGLDKDGALTQLTGEQRNQLSAALAAHAPQMIIREVGMKPVLINISAVKHVMTHNSDLFSPDSLDILPEEFARPQDWLQEQEHKWSYPSIESEDDTELTLIEQRFLLLTGVPRQAAEFQRQYRRAKELLKPESIVGNVFLRVYNEYAEKKSVSSELNRGLMEVILEKYGADLTEEQKRLLLNQVLIKVTVPASDAPGAEDYVVREFIGFDIAHDQSYAAALRKIYQLSKRMETTASAGQTSPGKTATEQPPSETPTQEKEQPKNMTKKGMSSFQKIFGKKKK